MVRTKAFQIDSKDKSLDQMSSHDFGGDSEKVVQPPQLKKVSRTMIIEYNDDDVKSVNSANKAKSEQIFATAIQQSNSMPQTPRYDG